MAIEPPESSTGFCGGCDRTPRLACLGSFARRGVRMVHWECWSRCNLSCSFCYRTRSSPLRGADARRLIQALAASGVSGLTFAGGDPSLRRDLPDLCRMAKTAGLAVEVQTNAHVHSVALIESLMYVDSIALSLDGATPGAHDNVRSAPGNFVQNLRFLGLLAERHVSTRVRTVVTSQASESIAPLGRILSQFDCVVEWGLQELCAVGDGLKVYDDLHAASEDFEELFAYVKRVYPRLNCRAMTSESKVGLYAMIRSDGELYGTLGDVTKEGFYPTAGNLLREHLSTLAMALPIDNAAHRRRYRSPR
ncbi:radical SAM protein [Micromonospora chersina]